MRRLRLLATLVLAAPMAACVAVPSARPPVAAAPKPVSIEDQKKDIAIARDRGQITFEEAAVRQYAIQRNAYRLSIGEERFWEASISEARRVDRREITPDEYKRRIQTLYAANVGA